MALGSLRAMPTVPKPLEDEKSERRLAELLERLRALSRKAKYERRRHEASVFVEADEGGHLTIRFRPDETLE